MKKLFITIITFLAITSTAMADGHVDSVRYLTTKVWKNWFVSADGHIDWWQGSDKFPGGNYTAVQWGKPSFGASISGGKWFTHVLGGRLSYDVNGGKSYINDFYPNRHPFHFLYYGSENFVYDEHGKLVSGAPDPNTRDENGFYNTSFIFHNLHGDVLFSPIDFFQGYYNPERLWTPVLYGGMGAACVSEYIFITRSEIQNRKDVEAYGEKCHGTNYELSFNAGLINNFRLSDHFDIDLELRWALQRWNIDSWGGPGSIGIYETYSWYFEDGTHSEASDLVNYPVANADGEIPKLIRPKRADNNYSIALGVTYYFSREYDLPIDCCAEMESFDKNLSMFAEPDTIVKFVNVQTEDMVSYPFSIFFNRDSYQLMSRRDIVNLRELANVAKENGYKIRLTGSCDSATATPSYNQTLSENRCRKIMMELIELGIPEDQIIIEPLGGVKHLDPTEYDRRVLVQLVKEAPKN